ncbi:pentatricopeptide repeat-containing protein [Trifolium medium]|uniref:Pentatricopeptide repeat-containing protein n=1 Tax=Trifolium medium TaxID=97028 RepID=A0A392MAF8_9FABA|nr:pentatricopeptide repeat-containing protein [Trifolium medium]
MWTGSMQTCLSRARRNVLMQSRPLKPPDRNHHTVANPPPPPEPPDNVTLPTLIALMVEVFSSFSTTEIDEKLVFSYSIFRAGYTNPLTQMVLNFHQHNNFISSTILNTYSPFINLLSDAQKLFEYLPHRNKITWSHTGFVYVQHSFNILAHYYGMTLQGDLFLVKEWILDKIANSYHLFYHNPNDANWCATQFIAHIPSTTDSHLVKSIFSQILYWRLVNRLSFEPVVATFSLTKLVEYQQGVLTTNMGGVFLTLELGILYYLTNNPIVEHVTKILVFGLGVLRAMLNVVVGIAHQVLPITDVHIPYDYHERYTKLVVAKILF